MEIVFQPDGKRVRVDKGTTIMEAAVTAGIPLETVCGGKGICGKCKVRLIKGDSLGGDAKGDLVLACQTKLISDAVIEVPAGTRLLEQKILVGGVEKKIPLNPNVRKVYLKLAKPSLSDQKSDLSRITCALERKGIVLGNVSLDFIRQLPIKLRNSDFKVTVILIGNDLVGMEEGDTTDKNYGISFDIGTTTVVGYLVDLNTGKEMAVASRMNPQVVYGEDVVSRIDFAKTEEGLRELNDKIIQAVNEIIDEVSVCTENIYEVSIVGNTCMLHLFLNITPTSLALSPYVSAFKDPVNIKASELGVKVNEKANIHVLPTIAGFVGADTIGVLLASQLDEGNDVRLAIDIGTNVEIALGSKEKVIACSAAAGPAFEGAKIRHGMRAAPGAIHRVVISDGVVYGKTIDNAMARGITGSGLVDAVAEMLKNRIISNSGKISDDPEIYALYGDRLVHEGGEAAFLLARGITVTQGDIRELQLAKGAIYAGINILMKDLGICDIKEILLAGAFGTSLPKENAQVIGLIPDIPLDRVKDIGNAAGVGSKMALISKNERLKAELLSEKVEYVELSGRKDFQDEFMDAMFFPHSNLDYFPNVARLVHSTSFR
ncbi:MAG: ASKHA domain-containing protein [Methanocellales archaeon]|nr:ASKHA domain-containing protein [Methanocellales archaeon]MDD3292269.1 ASKHA domain-containing protein [Methanocellales archaeon]MDD5485845.1 ASKHA domain-containing protein [Methanocellales archaeon]